MAVGLLLKQLVAGVAACVRCWALSVGLLMVATQAMLALSLLTYKVGPGRTQAQRSRVPCSITCQVPWLLLLHRACSAAGPG